MKKVCTFLNSDILFDVLSRIPAKTLLGLKLISREWHRIITNRSFIQAQLEKTQPILSGFILQEKFMLCTEDIKTISYIPVERAVTKVHRMVFNFLPEDVVVLASCQGLVCCRSCFPSQEPTIYVCNPSNKDWIRLKWEDYDKNESIGLAVDPFKNPVDISTKFKLVRVKQVEDNEEELYMTFELYSSETKTWKKSNEICQFENSLIKNKGIYIGDVLHWLTDGDQILTFDVEKEISWLVSVPVPLTEFSTIPEACIGESEGQLHYVTISEQGLHVWFLEDYFEFKWTLKHWKALEMIEKEHSELFFNLKNRVLRRVSADMNPWMDPLGFKDGHLLMKVCADLYLYDIEQNKMAEACTLQELNTSSMLYPTVLPHSTSLIPLNQV